MAINTIQDAPEGAFQDLTSLIAVGRGRKYGFSVYYRNPVGFREDTESSWISYDDALDSELVLIKLDKGFELLRKYGQCPGMGVDKYGQKGRVGTELWTPILTTAGGPGEFPAGQVKTYRWYQRMDRRTNAQGCASLHGQWVYFPQFAEAVKSGAMSYKEIKCPECRHRSFHEPWQLASHLRVWHNYDPKMLTDVGTSMGYDMKRTAKLIFNMDATEDSPDDYERNFGQNPSEPIAIATARNPYADLESYAQVDEPPKAKRSTTYQAPDFEEALTAAQEDVAAASSLAPNPPEAIANAMEYMGRGAAPVSDEPPAWAKAMMADIAALKKAKPARAPQKKSHHRVAPKPASVAEPTILTHPLGGY